MSIWIWFSQAVTVIVIFMFVARLLPVPLFDRGNATLMCQSEAKHLATSRALSAILGKPTIVLDTPAIRRFMFKDGTFVDAFNVGSSLQLMYNVAAVKTIVCGLFSRSTPLKVSTRVCNVLNDCGYSTQVIDSPDPAFPEGSVVLVLSSAFVGEDRAGFGVLIRKHALRIGGQRPKQFTGWPQ